MGEVIKYGLIEDPELWALLTELDGSVEDMDKPFEDLSEEDKHLILYGSDGKEFHFHYENEFGGVRDIDIPFEGVIGNIKRRYHEPIVITLALRCAST